MKILTTKLLAVLMLSFFAFSCEDNAPELDEQSNAAALQESTSKVNADAKKTKDNSLLTNISVSGILEDGGTFEGVLNITELSSTTDGALMVSGTLVGTATQTITQIIDGKEVVTTVVTEISQTITNVLASLTGNSKQCQILFLDLGPLELDLLGLQVDLSRITLDITAVTGEGKLLGNLLCALANLLNPKDGILDLDGITSLINQINKLL